MDYQGLESIMALLSVYPLHSEELVLFSDLYLPGSPGSVQQLCVFCEA